VGRLWTPTRLRRALVRLNHLVPFVVEMPEVLRRSIAGDLAILHILLSGGPSKRSFDHPKIVEEILKSRPLCIPGPSLKARRPAGVFPRATVPPARLSGNLRVGLERSIGKRREGR